MPWTYDIGPPKGDEPDWEEMKVDPMAFWILRNLPEDQIGTVIRSIVSSYAANSDDWANERAPVTFLRAVNEEGIRLECTIEEAENPNESFPLIRGSLDFHDRGLEMSANSLLLTGLPQATMAGIQPKTKLRDILDIGIMRERLIVDVKETDGIYLVSLEPEAPQRWMDLFPEWI